MIVRLFRPSDQQAVRRLILEGLGGHFGFIDESLNPDLDDIQSWYVDRGGAFFVAEENSTIVGTGSLLPESEGVGRIVRMSTAEAHRRKGIGSNIFREIVNEARRRGMRSLVIATEPHWEDAVGFYRSRGFVPYGEDDIDVFMKLEVGS